MNDMTTRASRKVAVLGSIPRDQILTHAGERVHKYGFKFGPLLGEWLASLA